MVETPGKMLAISFCWQSSTTSYKLKITKIFVKTPALKCTLNQCFGSGPFCPDPDQIFLIVWNRLVRIHEKTRIESSGDDIKNYI